uniref:CUE domain-containing protein n=1 Tax=Mesocestoides corti TaxID=53468 RepID=A0A5K3FIH0_MESCO
MGTGVPESMVRKDNLRCDMEPKQLPMSEDGIIDATNATESQYHVKCRFLECDWQFRLDTTRMHKRKTLPSTTFMSLPHQFALLISTRTRPPVFSAD